MRWLLIEVGSKQETIFATNKQVLAVGASHLIKHSCSTWVNDAIERLSVSSAVRWQLLTSGRASLLLTDLGDRSARDIARALLSEVTRTCLSRASALDIWGAVGTVDVNADDSNVSQALVEADRRLTAARLERRSPAQRYQSLPFSLPCHFTGLPATVIPTERMPNGEVEDSPRSAPVDQLWQAGRRARNELRDRLVSEAKSMSTAPGNLIERALVSEAALGYDGVHHNGWLAFAHVDGNGVGNLFRSFQKVYEGNQFLTIYSQCSAAVDEVTWKALAAAVLHIAEQPRYAKISDWILPIIIGGDDLAIISHAGVAFGLLRTYLREFEERANTNVVLKEQLSVLQDQGLPVPRRLTAAAGLSFVKPHHPARHAISMANDLEHSAKSLKQYEVSSMDFHVLYESSTRRLSQLRAGRSTEIDGYGPTNLWAGPVVTSVSDDLSDLSVSRLEEAMEAVVRFDADEDSDQAPKDRVSRRAIHQLRSGALTSPTEFARVLHRLRSRAAEVTSEGEPSALAAFLDQHVAVDHPIAGRPAFSRILTALELADVAAGTIAANARPPQEAGGTDRSAGQ